MGGSRSSGDVDNQDSLTIVAPSPIAGNHFLPGLDLCSKTEDNVRQARLSSFHGPARPGFFFRIPGIGNSICRDFLLGLLGCPAYFTGGHEKFAPVTASSVHERSRQTARASAAVM